MKPTILTIVFMALLATNHAAFASNSDIKRGQELSQHCIGCHGEFGIAPFNSNPNLAGQNQKYLVYALKAYRDGKRKGGNAFIMAPNAKSLSDQDIKDLAAFFSSQPGKNAKQP